MQQEEDWGYCSRLDDYKEDLLYFGGRGKGGGGGQEGRGSWIDGKGG